LYVSFADIVGDCVGRGVGADVIEAEGHTNESDAQFIVVGSQHLYAEGEGEDEGQIGIEEEHCILLGSQHPVSRKAAVGEGDGAISSEQKGIPGVHEPREGSQHLTPL
jgi:hypothetical protein